MSQHPSLIECVHAFMDRWWEAEVERLRRDAEAEVERLRRLGWKRQDFARALKNLLDGGHHGS